MTTVVDRWSLFRLKRQGFQSRFVETSLGGMHLLDGQGRGDLPPIVMMHGLSSRSTHYASMVQGLLPRAGRILMPDMLGHGLSSTPEQGLDGPRVLESMVELLLGELEQPALIFGNSMGAYGAIKFAARHPERVRALVIASPAGASMPAGQFQGWLDRFRVKNHAEALDFCDMLFARRSALRPVLAYGVRRQLSTPQVRDMLDRLGDSDLLTRQDLAQLAMPVLCLWGRQERVLLREHLGFFRDHLPGHADIEEPDGFGHSPYMDDPQRLGRLFLDFIERAVAA